MSFVTAGKLYSKESFPLYPGLGLGNLIQTNQVAEQLALSEALQRQVGG